MLSLYYCPRVLSIVNLREPSTQNLVKTVAMEPIERNRKVRRPKAYHLQIQHPQLRV